MQCSRSRRKRSKLFASARHLDEHIVGEPAVVIELTDDDPDLPATDHHRGRSASTSSARKLASISDRRARATAHEFRHRPATQSPSSPCSIA